jgi:hypothetical protein
LEGVANQRRRDAAAPQVPFADKVEERGGSGKGGGNAISGVDAAKSDGDAAPAPVARSTPEKKKAPDVKRAESGKSLSSNARSESPDADNGLAKRKEAAASPGSNRAAMGQARQFVVPVPKEIETRQLTAATAKPKASRDSESLDILPTPAPNAATRQASRDGKDVAESDQARRAPARVRVLFVIEPGAARPAAAAPLDKGPSGK